jgi:hypothetical protein
MDQVRDIKDFLRGESPNSTRTPAAFIAYGGRPELLPESSRPAGMKGRKCRPRRIVNGRFAVTAEVALKLAAAFRTTPERWLDAQKAVDLYTARSKLRRLPKPLV